MKNKIEDLRNHLFAALEGLADGEKPMEIERAKAIADVGRVIIETAKAEVAFLQATKRRDGTGFVVPVVEAEVTPTRPRLANGTRG